MNQSHPPAKSKETLSATCNSLKRSSKNLSRLLRHFEKQCREQKSETDPKTDKK